MRALPGPIGSVEPNSSDRLFRAIAANVAPKDARPVKP
jgi:hypothetical protein